VVNLGPSIRGNFEKINNTNILDIDKFEEYSQKTRMENHTMFDRDDIQELSASDGATNDLFGDSVSIDGEYAIIGAYEDDDNGFDSGSAYIFKRDGAVWVEQSKLLPSDGKEDQTFGYSVAIDGDYAIVGASHDDDNGFDSGSAYIFKRDGAAWVEQSKLLPSDGEEDQTFGYSVAIDGDYALIGAVGDDDIGWYSGSAYIFKCDGAVWVEQSKLLPSDGEQYKHFGRSVSINGDYAIIGASHDDDNGYCSGSAYIFKRDGTVWVEQSKLLPSDGEEYEYFGRSVSIDGQFALIGTWADDDNGYRSGSAYIFKQDGNIWTQQIKLLPSDGKTCGYFGFSVSIDGNYAIIGGYGDDDNGDNAGSVYVFKHIGTTWSRHVKMLAPDGMEDDLFGWSVAIDDDYAIIGARGADGKEPRTGSAYVFKNFSEFQSPSIPSINGPTSGKVMVKHIFFISAIDPYYNDVYYFIDWGDNTTSDWFGPFNSGKEISVNHTWLKQGNFIIRIKAKNNIGAISEWGTLTVTIPRNKAVTNNMLLLRILERFPLFQKLLQL
jgi:predicted amidohydrolase